MILSNINLVRSIINKRYLSKNPELYEDMLQEGIVGLIKAEKTFDASLGYKFTTYAHRVINNEILMFLKKYKNKHSAVVSYDNSIEDIDNEVSYSDVLSEEVPKEYIDLHNAINRLKPKQRETIYQVFFNDLIYKDAGEQLGGVSKQAVHKRLAVALKRLKKSLGDKYEDYN